MVFGDDDLGAVFFTDFAVDVKYGGVTKKGIVDANDASGDAAPTRVVDRITSLSIPSDAFDTALAREASITVDGVAMKIRDFMQRDDGAVTQVWVTLP